MIITHHYPALMLNPKCTQPPLLQQLITSMGVIFHAPEGRNRIDTYNYSKPCNFETHAEKLGKYLVHFSPTALSLFKSSVISMRQFSILLRVGLEQAHNKTSKPCAVSRQMQDND